MNFENYLIKITLLASDDINCSNLLFKLMLLMCFKLTLLPLLQITLVYLLNPHTSNLISLSLLIIWTRNFQGWKRNTLSMTGRIQLINSTLNSIPSHAMQSFYLPSPTLKKIDQINNNFLWGHDTNTRRMHHVSWKRVAAPKAFGGLGIRRTKLVNACFMAKIRWNILIKNTNLSTQTLSLKYGPNLSKNIHQKSFIRRSINKDNSIINDGIF